MLRAQAQNANGREYVEREVMWPRCCASVFKSASELPRAWSRDSGWVSLDQQDCAFDIVRLETHPRQSMSGAATHSHSMVPGGFEVMS